MRSMRHALGRVSLLAILAIAAIPGRPAGAQPGPGRPAGGGPAKGAQSEMAPKVGDPAPDFTLPYATADTIVAQGTPLSEAVRQGPVLLAFYPADYSPGCTKEVCTFRDAFKELGGLGITVWGISGDNVFAHRAWAQSEKLPFRLLSDTRHSVARSYGSFNEESGFNKRTVFLVGRDGRITYEDPAYSVQDDTSFQALKAAMARMR